LALCRVHYNTVNTDIGALLAANDGQTLRDHRALAPGAWSTG
jgi:hypothetical protein